MARTTDNHPPPDDPDAGVVPHFPPGTPKVKDISNIPRPGFKPDELPGDDYPLPRDPFPDHTPDPGIGKP